MHAVAFIFFVFLAIIVIAVVVMSFVVKGVFRGVFQIFGNVLSPTNGRRFGNPPAGMRRRGALRSGRASVKRAGGR